jgi:hypothetical protein
MVGAGEVLQRKRVRTLQQAVDRLPAESRRAMLQGLGEGPIIAGAYKVGPARCPGLAAYRHGARTGYTEFAKAWDRYVRGHGVRRAREGDVATLITMLRTGLPADPRPAATNGNGSGPHVNGGGPQTNGAVPHTNGAAPGANGDGLERARDLGSLRQ